MKSRKLELACPACGSLEVFYSCEPKCCFNHVCNRCQATFEPMTRATGERLADVEPPEPPPDSTEPTVGCAKCESIAVYLLGDGRLVCGDCGAVLALEMTEVK